MKKPSISILDPRFSYRNAANTDVRKTFERARKQLRGAEKKPAPARVDAAVLQLKKRVQGAL